MNTKDFITTDSVHHFGSCGDSVFRREGKALRLHVCERGVGKTSNRYNTSVNCRLRSLMLMPASYWSKCRHRYNNGMEGGLTRTNLVYNNQGCGIPKY